MTPISFTTHEFSTKVLRRGRSLQLREISTTPHVFMNNSLSTVIARLSRSRGNLLTTTRTVTAVVGFLEMTRRVKCGLCVVF